MEFVDNSLDDAEELYQGSKRYPYPIRVVVSFDTASKTLSVSDNCRGMNGEKLESLVTQVGESTKKGVPWLNGQFGFGLHSFRAAAKNCTVLSKTSSSKAIGFTLSRSSLAIEQPEEVEEFGSDTGTKVVLSGFDKHWWKDINSENLSNEIEQHFERLLARENLSIIVEERVKDAVVTSHQCKPFDYDSVEGTRVVETLSIKGEGKKPASSVTVDMVVAQSDSQSHKVRFFSKGRRINEVSHIPSFLKFSSYKRTLWGHPQLLGVIDVGDALEPVITRDDFQRSPMRTELYQRLVDLEGKLNTELNKVLEKQRVESLSKLEGVLSSVLTRIDKEDQQVVRKEKREHRLRIREALQTHEAQNVDEFFAPPKINNNNDNNDNNDTVTHVVDAVLATEADLLLSPRPPILVVPSSSLPSSTTDKTTEQKITDETKKEKPRTTEVEEEKRKEPKPAKLGYQVHFVAIPAGENGYIPRAHFVEDVIHINTVHPDFTTRLKSRRGRPKFTERLGAYLALIISARYHEEKYAQKDQNPSREVIYEDLMSTMNRIETALRRRLPSLQRSIDKILPEHFQQNEEEDEDEEDEYDDEDEFEETRL